MPKVVRRELVKFSPWLFVDDVVEDKVEDTCPPTVCAPVTVTTGPVMGSSCVE